MSNKFVKTDAIINYANTLVVLDEGSSMPSPSALRGGVWSRSGLTGENPFAEEGAFPILRKLEFLQAIERGESPAPYYFTGHGAGEYTIFQAPPIEEIEAALAAWKEFRAKGGAEPKAYEGAGIMARAWTLNGFKEAMFLTAREAQEILPQRSEWAVWEEEEDEDGKWTQIRTNLGHATQSTGELGWEGWHFTPQNQACTFQLEGDTWEYHTRVETLPDEVIVRRQRTKVEDGRTIFQWEIEEDSFEWTEDVTQAK